ncbi:hypothetical protein OEZ85_002105 [Tetradesmus obliquus]|uniref:Serine/threonine-protein phosphatase 2A 55 kDa regulatory subunit B n=1 Tax=Tetradesmus obliquus TaxID=3088 RepID=A0ABY8U262_TETOB|nr:hypothetical protein OEZ85_002105 [Tetradesmus obliquus]
MMEWQQQELQLQSPDASTSTELFSFSGSCDSQDLFGGGLLSQVSAAVKNFTATFPDVPGPDILAAAESFSLDFLDLDLELDREDVAQYYVSGSQAVLLLPCSEQVASDLNSMIAGPVGLPLLSWLHTLLLQPQHKLLRLLAAVVQLLEQWSAAHGLLCLQRLLAASHNALKQQQQQQHSQQQQQQLDVALELAALLGQSRLAMAKLLLLHGADPCARRGAALGWAARRRRCAGEAAMEALLLEHAAACSPSQAAATTAGPVVLAAGSAASGPSGLAQYLAGCPLQQRSVGCLLAALRSDCGQRCCGLFLDDTELPGYAASCGAGMQQQGTGDSQQQQQQQLPAGLDLLARQAPCLPPAGNRGLAPKPQQPPGEWQFLQCFGERQEGEEVHEADVISAVEFNADGSYLATGDKGGRVVLFEKVASQARFAVGPEQRAPVPWGPGFEFRYLTEFQSHEPEFDYLKSVEIEEGLNQVKWVSSSSSGAKHILSTNDKTIKLWKVYGKKTHIVTGWNVERPGGMAAAPALLGGLGGAQPYSIGRLRIPTVVPHEVRMVSRAKRIFSNAHTYHINSIGVSSDQAMFLSADDLRINLWSLEVPNRCFNMVDIKPANMEQLSEVITCAEFHPGHCSLFAYSSSKGCIRLGDLRSAALCDRSAKTYQEVEPEAERNWFSEIIASTSSLRFSSCGRYMLARDFMSLKLWDLAMEARPIASLPVHEEVRPRLSELYENDCIFDKFGCCMNGPATCFASGTYSNSLKVFDCSSMMQQQQPQEYVLPWPSKPSGTALEASRDPMRRRLQPLRAASPCAANEQQQQPEGQVDCSSKLLHMAWHPEAHVIACAAANSLYMFCA